MNILKEIERMYQEANGKYDGDDNIDDVQIKALENVTEGLIVILVVLCMLLFSELMWLIWVRAWL